MPDSTDSGTPNPDTTPAGSPTAAPAATSTDSSFEFDGEFDSERAKRLIEAQKADKTKLRAELDTLRAERDDLATKWQAHEDAQLSESQRKDKELDTLRAELAAERRAAALARHHLPDDALVFLTGESAEDIEAQASRLAALRPADETPQPPTPDLHRAPQPNLANGPIIPDPPAAFDPDAIALKARQRAF